MAVQLKELERLLGMQRCSLQARFRRLVAAGSDFHRFLHGVERFHELYHALCFAECPQPFGARKVREVCETQSSSQG